MEVSPKYQFLIPFYIFIVMLVYFYSQNYELFHYDGQT